jgi:hypothetical protein
LRVAWKRRGKW